MSVVHTSTCVHTTHTVTYLKWINVFAAHTMFNLVWSQNGVSGWNWFHITIILMAILWLPPSWPGFQTPQIFYVVQRPARWLNRSGQNTCCEKALKQIHQLVATLKICHCWFRSLRTNSHTVSQPRARYPFALSITFHFSWYIEDLAC